VRKDADNARTSLITTAAVAVMIPATAVGAYLWYGDFSALDERAVEQVRLAAQAAKSERDMQGTMASLEKAVQSNKDNLEAWELPGVGVFRRKPHHVFKGDRRLT